MKTKKLKVIDLFAGIGGMRMGFEQAGFDIVYSNDIDKYACQTYRANFGEIDERDIKQVLPEELPDFDVLAGGFPCQPFSMIGKRDGLDDPRGHLFYEVVRILNTKKPKAFFLENVKHLLKHNGGETYSLIKAKLENSGDGYIITEKVLDSKDFGVPQHRERIYIVGLQKSSQEFIFPGNTDVLTGKKVRDILEKKVDEKYYLSETYYRGLLKHKKRHFSKGSGFGCTVLNLDEVSNTIVSGNMGRERNLIKDVPVKKNRWGIRKLTERECARLQGFPDDFIIPVSTTQAYKQFGNAVSVPVIEEIAGVLKQVLTAGENISLYQTSYIKENSTIVSL
ncbi:DNA cytosine methyltransferase [Patescibacteria group bacterium]|nr:DNA cytosine methyltransferase [Patescibacteria group bacterium]